MKPSQVDVAVLFLFFTREKQTKAVFEQIKAAKPSKLFLYQDGPRVGLQDDIESLAICRAIVENIDWECEVHRKYQEKNYGCDPSEYLSQKWMFEYVDRGIILEDDDVPSQSFFPYCKELLDRYENDERINMICGRNCNDVSDIDADYLFTSGGSIWGWATWKRNVDRWDPQYKWMQDEKLVRSLLDNHIISESFLKTCKWHLRTGKEYYESIRNADQFIHHQLNIVPKYNLITNIGIAAENTHSVSDINKLPKATRKHFYSKRYEIGFPLKHPIYMADDMAYKRERAKLVNPSPLVKLTRKAERILYMIFPALGR